jgi:hypothetical protein
VTESGTANYDSVIGDKAISIVFGLATCRAPARDRRFLALPRCKRFRKFNSGTEAPPSPVVRLHTIY